MPPPETSLYPGAIDSDLSPAGKTNTTSQADDHPAHHNRLADAIEKVETELGINPRGASADVSARIAALEAKPGVPSGTGAMWFFNTPPAGWAILDGSTLTNAQTNYPALWAVVDPVWKSGSDIILPDLRSRVPIGKSVTRGQANALGVNEGAAEANRYGPHHPHSLGTLAAAFNGAAGNTGYVSSDHSHSGTTGTDSPDHTHGTNMDNSTLRPYLDSSGGPYARGGSVLSTTQQGYGASARHTHAFTTGGISANHQHAFTPTGTVSVSGEIGSTGLGITANTPPYLVVNFIIKL